MRNPVTRYTVALLPLVLLATLARAQDGPIHWPPDETPTGTPTFTPTPTPTPTVAG